MPPEAQGSRAALLDGQDPGAVLAAMEVITGPLLDTLPGQGLPLLRQIGLLAARTSDRGDTR